MKNKVIYTLLFFVMVAPGLASAASYNSRDVSYITPSRNVDVIDYIICLQQEVSDSRRSVRFDDALDDAELACDAAGFVLPASRAEPDAYMIRQFISGCGFRSDEALAGSQCGRRDRAGAKRRHSAPPVVKPAPRCRAPMVFRSGKCRRPLAVNPTPTCRHPLVFRNGKCRTPSVVNTTPRCPSPQVFRNGKCRAPSVVNTTPRCPPNKVFRNNKCR